MPKLLPITKNILLRLWGWNATLYVLVFLALWPISNYPNAIKEARMAALSRFIPDFTYLIDFRDEKVALDKNRMQEYYDYFRKVDSYVPDKADVLGLRAYCAYYLGHDTEALRLLQRAVVTYGYPFSFHYNLGALYYKNGDYDAAAKSLTLALKTEFIQNIKMISSSRIYFPLFRTPFKIDQELAHLLHVGYERCYRLLVLTHAARNDPANELNFSLLAEKQPTQDPAFFIFHAGVASAKLGAHAQAINFLTQYLSQNPKDSEALYFLGTSLQTIGQRKIGADILAQSEELKRSGVARPHKEEIILQIY